MSVDLTGLPLRRMSPVPITLAGRISSPLSGATTWIDRPGSRWAFRCETPRMPLEPDGRSWAALLMQARREGAILPIVQPGLATGSPGNPFVASATTSGRMVPIAGAQPGYVIRRGQWISLIVGGQRYADQVAQAVTVTAGGTATVRLQNLIRVVLPAGAIAEIAVPKVEGPIDLDDGWDVDVETAPSFVFTISEDR